MAFQKPCLDCGALTRNKSRCNKHQAAHEAESNQNRDHYKGSYKSKAKLVRQYASVCWLCGKGAIENDPWTADHYLPANPDSPLLPAHRSCNSRRGNKPPVALWGSG